MFSKLTIIKNQTSKYNFVAIKTVEIIFLLLFVKQTKCN